MAFKVGDTVTLNNDTRNLGYGKVDKLCATGALVTFEGFPESVWYNYKNLRKYADWENAAWNTLMQQSDTLNDFFQQDEAPHTDAVDSPSHYNNGSIECIDYLKDNLSWEGYTGYLEGNCKKYLHRWRYKKKPLEDLKKARWYLERLISELED